MDKVDNICTATGHK